MKLLGPITDLTHNVQQQTLARYGLEADQDVPLQTVPLPLPGSLNVLQQLQFEQLVEADLSALYTQFNLLDGVTEQYRQTILAEIDAVRLALDNLQRLYDRSQVIENRTEGETVHYYDYTDFSSFPTDSEAQRTLGTAVRAEATPRGLRPGTLNSYCVTRSSSGRTRCHVSVLDTYPKRPPTPYLYDPMMMVDDDPSTFFLDHLDSAEQLGKLTSVTERWTPWNPIVGSDPICGALWLVRVQWDSVQTFNRLQLTISGSPVNPQVRGLYRKVNEGALTSISVSPYTLHDTAQNVDSAEYLLHFPTVGTRPERFVRSDLGTGSEFGINVTGGEPYPGVAVREEYSLYRRLEIDGTTATIGTVTYNCIDIDVTDLGKRVVTNDLLIALSVDTSVPFHPGMVDLLDKVPQEIVPGEIDRRVQHEREEPFYEDRKDTPPLIYRDYLDVLDQTKRILATRDVDWQAHHQEFNRLRASVRKLLQQLQGKTETPFHYRYLLGISDLVIENRTYAAESVWVADPTPVSNYTVRELAVTLQTVLATNSTVDVYFLPGRDRGIKGPLTPGTSYTIGPADVLGLDTNSYEVDVATITQEFKPTDQDRYYRYTLDYPVYLPKSVVFDSPVGGPNGWLYNPNRRSFNYEYDVTSPVSDFDTTSATVNTIIADIRGWTLYGGVTPCTLVPDISTPFTANRGQPLTNPDPSSVADFGWSVGASGTVFPQNGFCLEPSLEGWCEAFYFSTLMGYDAYVPTGGSFNIWRAHFCSSPDSEYCIHFFTGINTLDRLTPTVYADVQVTQTITRDGLTTTTTIATTGGSGVNSISDLECVQMWVDWCVWLQRSVGVVNGRQAGPDEWVMTLYKSTSAGFGSYNPMMSTICSISRGAGLSFDLNVNRTYVGYVAQRLRYDGYRPIELTIRSDEQVFTPEAWGRDYAQVGPPEQVVDVLEPSYEELAEGEGNIRIFDGRSRTETSRVRTLYFSGQYKEWLPWLGVVGTSTGIQLQFMYQPGVGADTALVQTDSGVVEMGPVLNSGDYDLDYAQGRVYLRASGNAKRVYVDTAGSQKTFNRIQATIWIQGKGQGWIFGEQLNRLPVTYNRTDPVNPEAPVLLNTPNLDPTSGGYYPALDYQVSGRRLRTSVDLSPTGPLTDPTVIATYQTLALTPRTVVKITTDPNAARGPTVKYLALTVKEER